MNSTSEIIIRSQTSKEELDYLKWILGDMLFYEKYKYDVSLPDHNMFLLKTTYSDLIKGLDKNIFDQEIYDENFLNEGVKIIKKDISLIKKAIDRMNDWVKFGFVILPKYEIKITAYGPGGSYNSTTGAIIMKFKKNISFNRNPIHTIIHEIVHIGIENSIVKKYLLTHQEKEGLVDVICKKYFNDILVDYKIQKLGDENLIKFIENKNIEKLWEEIKKYKKNLTFSGDLLCQK